MSNKPPGPLVLAIVGPTAAGKSALAMQAARRIGAEIINADAFCLYRGMDIGTAKPSPADRAAVPHHLVDVLDVRDAVDVVWFQQQARAAIAEVWRRGLLPILTGGSGLYMQAVLDDLRFPGTDPQVRRRLEDELAEIGARALHLRLTEIDPAAAAAILPTNGRRIVRALEVNEITGRPFTATLGPSAAWCDSVRIGWDPGAAMVDDAIVRRVDQMWAAGFVEEVRGLQPELLHARTAARAVGYRQILAALQARLDPETAREPTVVATRRLARRQRSWFRRDPRVRWVQSPSHVAEILGSLEP